MIGHMRGCDSVSGGPRGFTRGGVGGLPRGGVRGNGCRASHADTDLSGRPRASRLDREAGPVVEGMAPAEQREHVLCAVGRPEGELPVPVRIE
jgi:hypothetical protein